MKIINLTSHEVILSNGFLDITFPPSGEVARVESLTERNSVEYEVTSSVRVKLPIHITPKIKITNLPEEQEGVYYIVSNYVAQSVKRKDLLSPLTDNSAVRDDKGMIISVKGFQQYTEQELMEV